MRKLLLLGVFILLYYASFASILRVGYWGSAVPNVDFGTADAAVTAAAAGDTILVFPNSNVWSFNNLNKKVVIIGSGYFHYPGASGSPNYNANLQNIQPWTQVGINMYPGADGSVITGCDVSIYMYGTAGVNNVKVTDCLLAYIYFAQPYTYDGWEVSKSYLYSTGIYGVNAASKVTNLKLFNCIAWDYSIYSLSTAPGQTGIIENCTFLSTISFNNAAFLIQNCIFDGANPSGYSNCVFNNNIFTFIPSPAVTGANNITSVSTTNLFIGYPTQGTYSNDARFALKTGSPAIGAGISGVDCGAFGGVNPYKLSGIPAVPAFYQVTAPTSAASTNPYTITFSVRANN